VNKEEKQEASPTDPEQLAAWIDQAFLTGSGQELAKAILLRGDEREKKRSAV